MAVKSGTGKRELNKGHKDGQEEIITHIIDAAGITKEDSDRLADLLKKPAGCLKAGGLVAFPTETVYGLGGDALNKTAAGRIYAAKGRPSDNPLIVHISRIEDMEILAYTNDLAHMLAQAFWPGPLTIILPKKELVPYETTGGLDTVAIRMPSHPAALELIGQSGVYVAAPSANISGRPSPTKVSHVIEDMEGKIEYIIDGGPVGIGIESTIVDVSGETPVILRPGFITKKMLEQIIGTVLIDPALEKPMDGFRPKAPGMKYTHYAPKGELTLVETCSMDNVQVGKGDMCKINAAIESGESGKSQWAVVEKICALAEEKRRQGFRVGIMAPKETLSCYQGKADTLVCVGDRKEQGTVAAGLYAALREFDAAGADYIYAESFRGEGLSYAIMNRLLKAAGQRVIRV